MPDTRREYTALRMDRLVDQSLRASVLPHPTQWQMQLPTNAQTWEIEKTPEPVRMYGSPQYLRTSFPRLSIARSGFPDHGCDENEAASRSLREDFLPVLQ